MSDKIYSLCNFLVFINYKMKHELNLIHFIDLISNFLIFKTKLSLKHTKNKKKQTNWVPADLPKTYGLVLGKPVWIAG